ncbi:MAG: DUF3048 domain-containing protein [Lachnospiraceae bacterium]|nr:DUF3048 domain-containing protein [Lachnospiraceae bacterium]
MRKLRLLITVLVLGMIISFSACGGKDNDDDIVPPDEIGKIEEPEDNTEDDEEDEEPEDDSHEGMVRSTITGLYIDENMAKLRPLAIMMGNTKSAAPQSGISEASVVYEIPVEGGITRLMSVIEGYKNLKKIGSVRSCRYYFCHYAAEYDALYAHVGQSKYAKATLAEKQVLSINGLKGETDAAFFRVSDRKAPHNCYAKGEEIYKFAEKKGYGVMYPDGHTSHFIFSLDEENELTNGDTAEYVEPGYSVDAPHFEYNSNDKLYYRFQYKDKHVDLETGEQLTCTNIIIQFVSISYLDDNESLKIGTTGSGEGYFITHGKKIAIKWKKDSEFAITHYYDEADNEIELNPGKTWILLVNKKNKDKVIIK